MYKPTHTSPFHSPVHVPHGGDLATGPGRLLDSLVAQIGLWHGRWQERRALLRLDERLLRDAGLTRQQALAEADKPFWQD